MRLGVVPASAAGKDQRSQSVDPILIDEVVVIVPAGDRAGVAEDLDSKARDAMQLPERQQSGIVVPLGQIAEVEIVAVLGVRFTAIRSAVYPVAYGLRRASRRAAASAMSLVRSHVKMATVRSSLLLRNTTVSIFSIVFLLPSVAGVNAVW